MKKIMRNQGRIRIYQQELLWILLLCLLLLSCGDDNPLGLPPVTQVDLVPIDPPAEIAALEQWASQNGPSLHFIVSNEYRTPDGFFFEGRNQQTIYEELTGRVEVIKDSNGWLRIGATFSYESEYAGFVESIFGPFAGIALDVYEPLSSEPYIHFPTEETLHWTSDTVFVSDGNVEFQRYFSYRIEYIGDADLVDNGQVVKEFSDVIRFVGDPNSSTPGQRPDLVVAYLAPDYGIIHSLFRFFDVENACALLGYGGSNIVFPDGESVKDYFPTAPGNQWLYEFSYDSEEGETVDFRFSVVQR
jgi:hypothetical protein